MKIEGFKVLLDIILQKFIAQDYTEMQLINKSLTQANVELKSGMEYKAIVEFKEGERVTLCEIKEDGKTIFNGYLKR